MHSVLGSFVRATCYVALVACGAAPSDRTPSDPPPLNVNRVIDPKGHDWTRFGWNAARTNVSTDETGITAQNVSSLHRQRVQLDGTVDSSPIYLHGVRVKGVDRNVFFVTTTYGKTIAIDADDASILWRYTPNSYDSWAGSRQITTATPVADPNRQFIYAASPNGHIQKLAIADGREIWSTAITRMASREKIASSLNYDRGRVIAVTGGYVGDAPPYQGHVAILDANSGRLTHIWNSLCSNRRELMDPSSCSESGSAMWGRAGAVVDTATGDIFTATGNALWDGRTNWGDATIVLDSTATNILDNFTPQNTEELSSSDADVGSTSPAPLGNGYMLQGGKDGSIRVLPFDRTRGATPRRGGEPQAVRTPSGSQMVTALAVMKSGSEIWIFATDYGGTAAFTFSGGLLKRMWENTTSGTSPVIAGGLLYIYNSGGGLRVYNPRTGQLVTTLECGHGHWNSPIIVDGRIALPEGDSNSHSETGLLNIWRLP
ncbi:MAG TPA: PQQ-binding-like beta-propeller repeat protein [Gemmatimonadaceae bacterium]|nr:PQQ-binding-like beta-propeller repeat protein [Gemmatimonadaceae bacterium]